MALALGVDLSTQSCTVLALDLDSLQIERCSVSFGQDLPHYNAPNGFIPGGAGGEVHADPRMWLDALELALQRIGQTVPLAEVVSIGGAAQQHGSVYLNKRWVACLKDLKAEATLAEQLTPALARETAPIWMDSSTTEDVELIAQALGGHAVASEKTGSSVIERFTGPQIHRFARLQPDAYRETTRVHLVSSFLCSVFLGTDAPIDYGDASGMNLLNLAQLDWDADCIEATGKGLKEKLPELAASGFKVGTVAPYFSKRYGLNGEAVVGVFTGDNHASHLGLIAGDSAPEHSTVISLGTSDTLMARVMEAITDPNRQGHLFCHPVGGYFALQCVTNGALARDRVREQLGMDWAQFAAALESTAPGNGGNFMLPFYGPETSPRANVSAPVFSGSEAFQNGEEPAALARACVEGQAFNLRKQTEWLNLQPASLKLTGGASQSGPIAQVMANVFNAPVERLEISDSVALGGLKLGLRAWQGDEGLSHPALEAFSAQTLTTAPHAEAVETYAEAYPQFVRFMDDNLKA